MALADRLAALHAEVEGRAAVGRAYYSAYHAAKWLIDDRCGVMVPTGPEVHTKLQWCLDHSQHPVLMAISVRLRSLRQERNRADYDLSDSKFASHTNVSIQLAAAKAIVQDLQALETDLTKFRSAIRDYARDVLKWRVKSGA